MMALPWISTPKISFNVSCQVLDEDQYDLGEISGTYSEFFGGARWAHAAARK